MAALPPAVAAIRTAVRRHLDDLRQRCPGAGTDEPEASLVLVACSGGPDSLALADAVAFVAPRTGWRAGLITVDHGLQPGSAERAEAVARWGLAVGLQPSLAVPVRVAGRPGGPEAAAREARYEALVRAAREHAAAAVLLGHTRDDQAETVLLALVRGSGPRGIAGMPVCRELNGVCFVRPLLDVSREQTRAACTAAGLTAWEDPHNTDPGFRRTAARAALRSLVSELGPAVVANLARTAHLVAADSAALDQWASAVLAEQLGTGEGLDCSALASLPEAVRNRVLHAWARHLGSPGSDLSHRHVEALAALVTDWHGQGPVHLPAGITVGRVSGRLVPGGVSPDTPMSV